MKKYELRKLFFKSLLLFAVSLSFASCSNLCGGGDSSSGSKPEDTSVQPKTFTVTGDIKIYEELTASGAIPEEYRSLFSFINNSDNSQERTAFPTVPTTGYYVRATAEGETERTAAPTTTSTGASFSMDLPANNPEKVWTIEAGMKASFNGSQVVILKDICTATPPTFYHEFVIKPLASGNGNVDLTINYQTANTADTLELYFGDTKITAVTANGEALSTTQITLKNRAAGAYKAKLIFKKNGYVVYTDYQGINIFPNMTTNTWVNSGGNGPVTGSTYTITDALVQDYLLTQIYVGKTKIGNTEISASNTTGNGTVFAPYETFAKAIQFIKDNGDTGKDYTIWISGEITGSQTVSDGTTTNPTPVKAKSLTISGVTGNTTDKLKGGTSGSVLYLDTSVPVKISNLTITGGIGTSVSSVLYGGGIYINKGSIELTTGAVVNGNTADIGGGIYLNAGDLYINGTAVVGNPDATECAKNESGKYGNKVTSKGGGIGILSGTLHIGYKPGTTPQEANTTGGVFYNLAANTTETHGGGIDNDKGTINFAHGYVKYNYVCGTGSSDNDVGCGGGISTAYILNMSGDAQISNNKAAYGGAVYITKDSSYHGNFSMSGGTITANQAEKQHEKWGDGGGVAVGLDGTFTLSGGTISSNTAENSGGAVYHHGTTFEITGNTATIPSGTGDTNDIAFYSNDFKIKVTGSTGSGDGEIALTPAVWVRGSKILDDGSNPSYFNKFKITDSEWNIVAYNDGTYDSGRLDADIWVAGQDDTRSTNIGAPDDTNGLGTPSKPYATIAHALTQCWNSNADYTIYIDGQVMGPQSIGAEGVAINAKSITLEGNGAASTINGGKATLNGNSSGSTLTINYTSKDITIENLFITGGRSNKGGGIYASNIGAMTLTLGTGVEIASNKADSGSDIAGGGVYFQGDSPDRPKLIINEDAKIYGNTTAISGGGIYIQSCDFFIYGNAEIGQISNVNTHATSANYSNYASYGGGLYAASGCNVYLGYSAQNTKTDFSAWHGIRYNYAWDQGGGMYISNSNLYMASGMIAFNSTRDNCDQYYGFGGGIYWSKGNNESYEANIIGGAISCNYAHRGGGIYIKSSGLTIDGTEGEVAQVNIESNTVDDRGGAIFMNAGFSLNHTVNIPYGNSARNNDIWFYTSQLINIGANFSTNSTIVLRATGVVAGYQFLDFSNNSSPETLCPKFSHGLNASPVDNAKFINKEGKIEYGYLVTSSTIDAAFNKINSNNARVVVYGNSISNFNTIGSKIKDSQYTIELDLTQLNLSSLQYFASAFKDCTKLTKVAFNGNYIAPRAFAFDNCVNLTEVKVVGNLNPTNNAFEGVTAGSWSGFKGCTGITTFDLTECSVVNLSAGFMYIEEGSNKLPSVTTVILGSGLTKLHLSNTDLFSNNSFHLEYAGSASRLKSEVITTHSNGQRETLTCTTGGGSTLTFNSTDNSWN